MPAPPLAQGLDEENATAGFLVQRGNVTIEFTQRWRVRVTFPDLNSENGAVRRQSKRDHLDGSDGPGGVQAAAAATPP
jgi:hypothetical protein